MSAQGKVILSRLGSDPEFVFADAQDRLFPAQQLVSNSRDTRTASWIGTDGHAATGEIRPLPAHNVGYHMSKIADAMTSLNAFLRGPAAPPKLRVVAWPEWGGEPMGGHIHVSLYYRSALSRRIVNGAGYVLDMMGRSPVNSRIGFSAARDEYKMSAGKADVYEYVSRAQQGEELSLAECWLKLHWLLEPLENAIFYGVRGTREGIDAARMVDSWDHKTPMKDGCAYFRFEYRYPSTWLQHPTVALAYFSLAKLALLNWNLTPALPELLKVYPPREQEALLRAPDIARDPATGELRVVPRRRAQPQVVQPKREAYVETLRSRLTSLLGNPDVVITPDVKGVLRRVDEALTMKFDSTLPLVDFAAWYKFLLLPGGQ